MSGDFFGKETLIRLGTRNARKLAICTWLALTCASTVRAELVYVACLGDSITAGARVNAAKQSYPAQLQRLLGEHYPVRNFGIGGATLIKTGKPNAWQTLPAVGRFSSHTVVVSRGIDDTVRTASNLQVQRAISNRSVGRWRRYERHLPDLSTSGCGCISARMFSRSFSRRLPSRSGAGLLGCLVQRFVIGLVDDSEVRGWSFKAPFQPLLRAMPIEPFAGREISLRRKVLAEHALGISEENLNKVPW